MACASCSTRRWMTRHPMPTASPTMAPRASPRAADGGSEPRLAKIDHDGRLACARAEALFPPRRTELRKRRAMLGPPGAGLHGRPALGWLTLEQRTAQRERAVEASLRLFLQAT